MKKRSGQVEKCADLEIRFRRCRFGHSGEICASCIRDRARKGVRMRENTFCRYARALRGVVQNTICALKYKRRAAPSGRSELMLPGRQGEWLHKKTALSGRLRNAGLHTSMTTGSTIGRRCVLSNRNCPTWSRILSFTYAQLTSPSVVEALLAISIVRRLVSLMSSGEPFI